MPPKTQSIRPNELAIIRQVFDNIDTDNSGTIEVAELAAAMKQIVPDATDEEIDEIFAQTDLDRNGTIEFEEFVKIIQTWLEDA
ncbi:hypothetical protein BLNAU_20741 [Blattamonas nauphoetae]|uniref:EF-hand domain-containing protein n=1 Tax=Blattamonas nauphoetae TaxID=2049346 RepID=A0ABQ9WY02_9EUKA|nr:hypothetical protein BLNAU_20741 [Blattamonas nauphoetae]